MSVTPSAPPDASATQRGFLNTLSQVVAGAKTFLSTIIASAGIQVASLFNTNGTGSTDVGVRVGVSTADGSVNASAKLLSVRTGIGATEVEYIFARKSELTFWGPAVTLVKWDNGGANQWQMRASPTTNFSIGINASAEYLKLRASDGFISTDFGIAVGDGSFGSNASYLRIAAGSARIDQWGTDSTGSPGAATINKPTGKSAIASGASTVVITNSLVATTSRVMVTFHGDHGAARWWVVVGAGSFTVTLSAAASANTSFSWEVSNIL